MMESSNKRIWIGRITLLLAWMLIAYQVPALITNESKVVEVFGRFSLWYFVILLGYLSILLALTLVGIWLIRASRADSFAERFDKFLSNKKVYILAGLLLLWLIWVIVNHFLFIPSKVTQGISNALYIISTSVVLLYVPVSFLVSHILIPIGVFSVYCVSLMFLLPEGVNEAFVRQSAKIFIPVTIVLLIAYISYRVLSKKKEHLIRATDEFSSSDLILPLLPLTPVIQYLINNTEILSWFEGILVFGIFLIFASLLIFLIPLLFRSIGATRPLMFFGMAFSFLITNMAILSAQYEWYQEGSLQIQLLVLGGIWIISWLIFKTNFRGLLYLVIAVSFVSNSIVQFSNLDDKKLPTGDEADNGLVRLVDDKEPVITPSIYLLVYDSYVINETMLDYGIDNQVQEQYLEELDFKIYPHTYSVKSKTASTMSRVLNCSTSYYGNRRRAISGDGIVQNLLKNYGYDTYGIFPIDYYFRGIIPTYDYWFPDLSSSVKLLSKAIFLGELRFDINFDEVPREVFLQEKSLILSKATDEPRFIYTHSELPGHSIQSGSCRPNETELFIERLTSANDEMRQDLKLVLENDPEAIVIIAGDHGPRLTKNCYFTEDKYDLSEITRLDIQDFFRNKCGRTTLRSSCPCLP